MDYIKRMAEPDAATSRQFAYLERSGTARAWARKVLIALFVVSVCAVWKDRGLAPPAHDWMHATATQARAYVDGSESLSGILSPGTLFSEGHGFRPREEFNALTRWLLDWRG